MNNPAPSIDELTLQFRNALCLKNHLEITKEIVGSLYGQVMPEAQVKSLCERLDVIQSHLVGNTTSQPPSGSLSTTSSPPSKRQPSPECHICDGEDPECECTKDVQDLAELFSTMQNSVTVAAMHLPNVGEYIQQLEERIGNLKSVVANARGWIMANTCVPAHDILNTLNTHLEDKP